MILAGLFGLLFAGALAGALVPLDEAQSGATHSDEQDDFVDPWEESGANDPWGALADDAQGGAPGAEISAELSVWDHIADDPWRDPAWSDPSIIAYSDTAESSDLSPDPAIAETDGASLWDHLSGDPWRDPTWADPSIISYSDGPESSDGPPQEIDQTSDAQPPEWAGGPGDTLSGGPEGGFLRGSHGDDVLTAQAGANHLHGEMGDDTLFGGPGADTLDGGEGQDVLVAGSGTALLRGGEGDDLLVGGAGEHTLQGGDGADTLMAGDGVAMLDGGFGNDLLFAGKGIGTLFGGAGDDTLVGAEPGGIALLNGGGGDDTVILGQFDVAHGGSGADTFVLGAFATSGGAFIQDFDQAEDRLVIVYDPLANPDPTISLASVAGQPGAVMVMLDGAPLALVNGGEGLLPDDIDLVAQSPVPPLPTVPVRL